MPKSVSTLAVLIATVITAIGFLVLLALSLSAAPNLLAWSTKVWFLPVTIALTSLSALLVLLAGNRKSNPSSKQTQKMAARSSTR